MIHTAHQPGFRVFCGLLAAFWAGLVFVGAAQMASAAPVTGGIPRYIAAKPVPMRCPMCAAMARAGGKSGSMPPMKCCCCAHGAASASCACQCAPQPRPHTVALLAWSPLAVLPKPHSSALPVFRACTYFALAARFCTLCRTPLPRPPRLL